jgi:hypothetical protein
MNLLSSWNEEYPPLDSLRILTGFALQHARMTTAPLLDLITKVHKAAKEGSIDVDSIKSLLDWEVVYDPHRLPDDLYHERQALAYFTKSTFLDIGLNRDAVAFQKFTDAEHLCRETNTIFKSWSRGDFSFPRDVDLVFYKAAKKIAKLLGDVPELNQLRLRFGPGASTMVTRRRASAREKLSSPITCSGNLFPMAQAILEEMPLWVNAQAGLDPLADDPVASVPVVITAGKLSFVPKNAKTFRAIVTEPLLNGMVQLGIGDYLQKRLLAFGVDIRDQSLNQRLAREGSLTGALATLDLSSASDTISRELVYHLLPLDWACFLDRYRSRTVVYEGREIDQHKFSSMGNGFTFPLETLIFWAITRACCDDSETVSVYGDDIICPTHRYSLVSRALHCAGFVVNHEKSYSEGRFRESCGADYFRGFDIRPVYHKSLVSPASLFVLHNFYKRNHDDEMAGKVLNWIHPSLRIYGPDGYGDGHLLGDWKPKPHKRKIGYSGYIFDTFTLKPVRDRRAFGILPGDGVLPAYSVYLSGEIPERDRFHDRIHYVHGRLVESTPSQFVFTGSKGYKRVSIYTLTAA